MEKDYIYKVLTERGYNAYEARLASEELLKLHEPLDEYLSCWLQDEADRKDFEIHPYSLSQLQAERQMNYPAALLTMDWLIKEPDKAMESLNRKMK